MFDQLEGAVDGLEIPNLGASLAAVIRLRDRLDAKIALAVGSFDRSGSWQIEGATSMTAWLRDQGGVARRQVPGLRATAKRLFELPGVAEAATAGVLSGGQVQAVVAAVSDDTVENFASQEAELISSLAGMSPADTFTVLTHWQARAKAGVGDAEPEEEPVRSLHHSCTIDNRWEGSWSLDAEGGALLDTAIELATTKDLDGDPIRSAAQRRADAIVDICREFLAHQHGRPAGVRTRPHIGLLIDPDHDGHPGTGRIIDGPVLSESTRSRLLCDCAYQRIVMAGGSVVIDLGRTTRNISVAMWRTLVARDQHCRFPGCDRPPRWCQAHHVHPWETGGPTDQTNLVLLCSRHHHLIHLPGWHTKLQPDDATLTITFPDRAVRTSQPPGRLRLALDG